MNNKKLKIAFYTLLTGLVLLVVSSVWIRCFDYNHMSEKLYTGLYYAVYGSLFLSITAVIFVIYFLLRQKIKRK